MQSLATRTRVNQITILVAISFLAYQFTNWQHGIWIVISTVVVAAPFSTFLSFEKAKFRFVGTLIGLMASAVIEYYLKYNPDQFPVIGVIIGFIAGFMATKSYRYFIIVITLCTCLGFSNMNMPYTAITPFTFLIDRAMGVSTGVLIFILMQRFVFGKGNSILELQEESQEVLGKLQKTLQAYQATPTLTTAYKCAADIASNTQSLKSYVSTAKMTLGSEGPSVQRLAKQVLMLNDRAVRLLIDEPEVVSSRISQLLQVVTAKLAR